MQFYKYIETPDNRNEIETDKSFEGLFDGDFIKSINEAIDELKSDPELAGFDDFFQNGLDIPQKIKDKVDTINAILAKIKFEGGGDVASFIDETAKLTAKEKKN